VDAESPAVAQDDVGLEVRGVFDGRHRRVVSSWFLVVSFGV
jgi:hypothetical protein